MIRHHFPHFFFRGLRKYIRRSALFTETILHYRTDDAFYTTGRNVLALVAPITTLALLVGGLLFNWLHLGVAAIPVVAYIGINWEKFAFVFGKAGLLFGLYFIFMSFIVTLLMFLGAVWGMIGFFSVGARHVYGVQNEY